jgi:hypothetical protein
MSSASREPETTGTRDTSKVIQEDLRATHRYIYPLMAYIFLKNPRVLKVKGPKGICAEADAFFKSGNG